MTTADRIKAILAVSRKARNSDEELQLIYMQKAGMDLTPHQIEVFKTLPSMETIRRTRQIIQASGMYQADQEVRKVRKIKSTVVRQTIADAKPEQVEKIIQTPQVQELLRWIEGA